MEIGLLKRDTPLNSPCVLISKETYKNVPFFQPVLLLIENSENGSKALALNQKSPLSADKLLAENIETKSIKIPIWHSGLHETDTAYILHNQKKYDDELELAPGVNLSTSFFTLKRMLSSNKRPLSSINKVYPFRILIGAFKWSSGELEKNSVWIIQYRLMW